MKKAVFAFLGVLLLGSVSASEPAKFPHREKFKNVSVVEMSELGVTLDQVVLVDVRSKFEYDTLHIQGALHIPLSKDRLPVVVQELRKQTTKPIVFYCNGTTCKKSYEAAEIAMKAGIANVRAYDAGLDAWSRQHPERCVLLGKSSVKAEDFIATKAFKDRLITAKEFETRLEQGAIVLDIRDLRQRDVALFPFKEHRATLDDQKKIADVLAEAKKTNKALLVYDKVGKQTRWFQYLLEKQGVKNYFFMDGGSEGYYDAKFGKPNFHVPDQS
jgi:rhodanese-related sulfurtransferase